MVAPMSKTFVREIDTNSGVSVKIHQLEVGDVGCVVWDAALVLCKYLESPDFGSGSHLQKSRVLEVGAGTGCVGIVAAVLGANATITDLPDFVPLIQMNISENKSVMQGTADARSLTWGKDKNEDKYRYILLADCIYYEESIEPLVRTLDAHCDEDTEIFCCYEERTTGNKPQLQQQFFKLINDIFDVEEIPLHRHDEHFRCEDIHIMKFVRKKVCDV